MELPDKAITMLTYLFNETLRLEHLPILWKVAEVNILRKPGKSTN